jgi:hypothetical protein
MLQRSTHAMNPPVEHQMRLARASIAITSVLVDAHGIRLSIPNFPHMLFRPTAPLARVQA